MATLQQRLENLKEKDLRFILAYDNSKNGELLISKVKDKYNGLEGAFKLPGKKTKGRYLAVAVTSKSLVYIEKEKKGNKFMGEKDDTYYELTLIPSISEILNQMGIHPVKIKGAGVQEFFISDLSQDYTALEV